ncbi:fumarylacetoacetase [Alloacidobacterium dinghuense]|uniref:fumarylacetoacetase n=1 Tax=Alloacidobacterium dinghuense TaxID=2763107 RepID=A0A7G8BCI5_9BACT|nr:fumarylacetoacetase [Alloacidobacterium dinghuense]QNI30255.1 fumarylacetoacetase [Alloacidobacterium dinghuense]
MAVTVDKSWVESANDSATDFPLQNLPFGVFSASELKPRIGVAIGDRVLDIRACAEQGLFRALDPLLQQACTAATLNGLMSHGRRAAATLRARLIEILRIDVAPEIRSKVERNLRSAGETTMHLPTAIGDYTDFYASIYHATNVGRLFRPDNPLLPNYKHVPIGYHGRASSIVVSGTEIKRPCGQTKAADAESPAFGPSRLLDYELEVGFFVAEGNRRGEPVSLSEAESHIFGLCLLNDWSARDIQAWEYQPLGPFLAKSFATSVSPWVVTLDALEPFRTHAFERAPGDPQPLPYLNSESNQKRGGIDLKLEVLLSSRRIREAGQAPARISRGNARDLYWTLAQMLTHHTSNGCNLQPGDLLASGTVSGAAKESVGSLLEMTQRGAEPIPLPSGETRKFLEDGDEVIFRAYCEREGHPRIGFGECRGVIQPAS